MMGRNHARSGAVVWLAGAAVLAWAGAPVDPVPVVGGAVLAGYAARLPDIDHQHATVSHTWGAPLRALYQLVRGLVWLTVAVGSASRRRAHETDDRWFGHRDVTHTAVFAAGTGALLTAASVAIAHAWPAVELAQIWWVGPAVGVGCLVHTAGDMLTNSGCPIWAPWSWRRRSARLFEVNGWFERRVLTPALYGALCALPVLLVYLAGGAATSPAARP